MKCFGDIMHERGPEAASDHCRKRSLSNDERVSDHSRKRSLSKTTEIVQRLRRATKEGGRGRKRWKTDESGRVVKKTKRIRTSELDASYPANPKSHYLELDSRHGI